MASIKFVDGNARRSFQPTPTNRQPGPVEEGEEHALKFWHHEATEDELELFEARVPAGVKVAPHAHSADEIIVILEGSLVFGKQSYGPGSSVFVPKMTLYSFQTGPEGVTFLNFRPTDSIIIFKDEFMEMRRTEKAPV